MAQNVLSKQASISAPSSAVPAGASKVSPTTSIATKPTVGKPAAVGSATSVAELGAPVSHDALGAVASAAVRSSSTLGSLGAVVRHAGALGAVVSMSPAGVLVRHAVPGAALYGLVSGMPEPLTSMKSASKPCCDDCGPQNTFRSIPPTGNPLPRDEAPVAGHPFGLDPVPFVYHGTPVNLDEERRLGLVSIGRSTGIAIRTGISTDHCSGVMISPRWTLAVQHCVDNRLAHQLFVPNSSHFVRRLGETQVVDRYVRVGAKVAMLHVANKFSDADGVEYAAISPFSVDTLFQADSDYPVVVYGLGPTSDSGSFGSWTRGAVRLTPRDSLQRHIFQSLIDRAVAENPLDFTIERDARDLVFSEPTRIPQLFRGDSGGPWFLSDGYGPDPVVTSPPWLLALTEALAVDDHSWTTTGALGAPLEYFVAGADLDRARAGIGLVLRLFSDTEVELSHAERRRFQSMFGLRRDGTVRLELP